MKQTESHDITVVFSAGDYRTNQVCGNRASSTMSAQAAADRLGRKVYGEAFRHAEKLHDISVSASRWRLHAVWKG